MLTHDTGELLPHLFTLTPPLAGRLFSVANLYPRGYLPFREYGALCCPDFPYRLNGTMEQSAVFCKSNEHRSINSERDNQYDIIFSELQG